MLPGSRLTKRFTLVILAIIVAIIAAFYFYSVPLIKSKVFEIERNASRIALNNVFALAEKMQTGTLEYREQVLESQRQRLRTVVNTTAFFYQQQLTLAASAGMESQAAQHQVLEQIRRFSYGDGDYVWIADEQAQLISHPDSDYFGRSTERFTDEQGNPIIPPVVEMAMRDGEGFYRYRWHRLNETQRIEKFSYVKYFPQWHFVIGSGVYIDDIDAEVEARRKQALAELRQAFSEIKVAETGYLFIFDENGRMLVHPNQNIDGFDFRTLENPVTGNKIKDDLISVADTGQELYYKWDRPDDPGDYRYEKVSLVRFLPGFNWYICSSVYLDELQASSGVLVDRILVIATIALLCASLLALLFAHLVTRPIRQLSETAQRISNGDFNATTGIRRNDEIGLLAGAFDRMVDNLKQNIVQLDDKVSQRTSQLHERNLQLQQVMQEVRSAHHSLELAEELQRLILDTLPAQIAYIDDRQRYVFVNEGYAHAFNRSKAEVIGLTLEQVVGSKMYGDIRSQVEGALEGVASSFIYTLNQDGEEHITKRTLIPFSPSGGGVHGLINLSLDVTAEKEAEQRLRDAQRMHTVGQLAGGLAHDFNNLLSILQGNLIAMKENPATPAALMVHIEPAIRATRRGSDITRRLLAFAGRQPLSPSHIDLPALMHDCMTLIEGSLPSNIRLEAELPPDLWSPLADPGQLEDVLVNLALNARDAMPSGGELRFCVRNCEVDNRRVMDTQVAPGRYIELRIADTGRGFSAEAMEKAFEPFFTTRQGANSSGLGLSMVYGFVKQSRGYIALANRPAGGALITLLLPAGPVAVAAGADAPMVAPAQPAAGGLVLLVDDEDDVRAVIRDQLVKLGYAVIDCASAQEALALIGTLPPLAALVSDIVMPGEVSGFVLARHLRQVQPDAAVVLISGYAQRRSEHPSDCASLPLLPKPFNREELAAALHSPAAKAALVASEQCERSDRELEP